MFIRNWFRNRFGCIPEPPIVDEPPITIKHAEKIPDKDERERAVALVQEVGKHACLQKLATATLSSNSLRCNRLGDKYVTAVVQTGSLAEENKGADFDIYYIENPVGDGKLKAATLYFSLNPARALTEDEIRDFGEATDNCPPPSG